MHKGLGILDPNLVDRSPADIAATRWEATFLRTHGPQPRCGVAVVYFAGTEGIMDTPDDPAERPPVSEFMANMIP